MQDRTDAALQKKHTYHALSIHIKELLNYCGFKLMSIYGQ